MKTNKPVFRPVRPAPTTAHGAPASVLTNQQQLRRLTASGMLWEDNAYISGVAVATEIARLIPLIDPVYVAACAYEARTKMKLRHMPLFIAREMARGPIGHRLLVAKLLPDIIQRADELSEFLAIYWKDGPGQPLSAQVKKGLAAAFGRFNEYQLAKYNRDSAVRLRDVAFLTHPKPAGEGRDGLMARLVNKTFIPAQTKGGHLIDLYGNALRSGPIPNTGLDTPDTWEVELSAGKGESKQASWERLLIEQKLGGLAFLRNLRNMKQAGVSDETIRLAASMIDVKWVLPYRFIAAARIVPGFEDMLEPMMFKALADKPKLPGHTVLVVDVSTSMNSKVSAKSDLSRQDAALALAMLARELCESVDVLAFNMQVGSIAPRRGFALGDAILAFRKGTRDGTDIGGAVVAASSKPHDRLIVITDEQSHTKVGAPGRPNRSYMINVASMKNGVGYGAWNHIDGWSEAVLDYIAAFEEL